MAPRIRRLGTVLSELLDVLQVLDATPAPRGHERLAAETLRTFAVSRWPETRWTVQPYGADGANLVASHGPGPLLYSHLDTSLDGGPADEAVTGRFEPVGALSVSDGTVSGFGLGVARAPAAAALVGFVGASAGTLLLAGSGTHRRGSGATGLDAYLATNPLPPSAIVAKSGPPGVLWAEPGALYATVVVRGRGGVAMAPDSAQPPGGVAAQAGAVLAAVDGWRRSYLAAHPAGDEIAPAVGIGSVRAGRPDKPDLLPAVVEIGLYVVTVDGVDPSALRDELAARVGALPALSGARVSVEVDVVAAPARTAPDAPIVRAARAVWAAEIGAEPVPVTGWTGCTDGVVLRGRGVDTVRLGPTVTRSAADPRRDEVDLAVLDSFARSYRRLLDGG